MIKSGIIAKKIPDSQKGSYYSKIFPINQDPFSNDTLDQIRLFSKKLENVKETNLLEYVHRSIMKHKVAKRIPTPQDCGAGELMRQRRFFTYSHEYLFKP